jgi:hypothetical protein
MSLTNRESTSWISVGVLADNFAPEKPDSNVLPRSNDLAGTNLTLSRSDDIAMEYSFASDRDVSWRMLSESGKWHSTSYLSTSLRPGIYFVDLIESDSLPVKSVSLVLDLDHSIATVVTATLPDAETAHGGLLARAQHQEELTSVTADIIQATINIPFDSSLSHHRITDELVGLRLQHHYNREEIYEHIYLNENRYVWHCLSGIEKGLGDVDRCDYLKISRELYLFVWREKIVPTLGVILVDLQQMKTTGKILGYAGEDFQQISNFPVGARSKVLNKTEHIL